MIRILGKHGNFDRIELVVPYGIQYWAVICCPTAYGCSIWFPSSAAQKDLLESLQYQAAAKITIGTKMNALLAELGWEPINAFLNRQSFSLFLMLWTRITCQVGF